MFVRLETNIFLLEFQWLEIVREGGFELNLRHGAKRGDRGGTVRKGGGEGGTLVHDIR